MSPIRRTKHAVYDVKYHIVWVPKYRKKILAGEVAEYARQVLLRIAREYEWQLEEMSVQIDHVHLFIHAPPKYSPARIEFWGPGYFVRSVGDEVTAEVIRKYIQYQEEERDESQLLLWD
jgi:putative transposase